MSDTSTTFVSKDPANVNANYRLTLNEDFKETTKVCFGYVSTSTIDVIESTPFGDHSNSGIGVCNDNSYHNIYGEV